MPTSLFAHLNSESGHRLSHSVMLAEVQRFNWRSSAAGPIESWPAPLKYAARTMLLSSAPMAVLIGPDGLLVYNDATRALAGDNYDGSLGKPVAEALPDEADFLRRSIDDAFNGQSSSFRDKDLRLHRHETKRTLWFDLDFTPIIDEHGTVHGTLLVINETTSRVLAVRDLRRSRERLDLALSSGGIVGTWEVDFATETLTSDERFARLHGVDPGLAGGGADKDLFLAGIHPDDLGRVMEAFDEAKRTGNYRCQHRVVGTGVTRWIVASGRILLDDAGLPVSFSGIAVDVTQQIDMAAALGESEQRFKSLADSVPQIVFSAQADGTIDYLNRRWHEFTGQPDGPVEADSWQEALHPLDRPLAIAAWRRTVETGERYDVEFRYRHRSGEYHWMRVIALPVLDEAGGVTRWFGTKADIHAAKLLEVERALVARELDHRIKNIFALVDSLIALTLREDNDGRSFAHRLRGRLMALNDAHDLIKADAEGAPSTPGGNSLHQLVRRLLAPYESKGDGPRLAIEGIDVSMPERMVTRFALVFHELATNSAKYGALGSDTGKVLLRCSRAGDWIHLIWKEWSDRRSARETATDGFGSRLLSVMVDGQMKGRLSREMERDGIRVSIELPIDILAEQTR